MLPTGGISPSPSPSPSPTRLSPKPEGATGGQESLLTSVVQKLTSLAITTDVEPTLGLRAEERQASKKHINVRIGKVCHRKEEVRKALLQQGFPDDYTPEDQLVALSCINFNDFDPPEECDIQTVESLLERGFKLYFDGGRHGQIPEFSQLSCDEILSSVLLVAKWGERKHIVKKVLEQAIEVHGGINKITINAMPAIENVHLLDHLVQSMEVSHRNSPQCIQLLKDYGVNLEKRNKHNVTAIGYCLKKGVSGASNFSGTEQPNCSIPLTALLKVGADITCTVPKSQYDHHPGNIEHAYSLLFTGFFDWSKEIYQLAIQQLVEKGYNLNDRLISAQDVHSSGVLINYFSYMAPDENPGSLTLLEASVLAGQQNAVHCLLEAGVDPAIRPIVVDLIRRKGTNLAFELLDQHTRERRLDLED